MTDDIPDDAVNAATMAIRKARCGIDPGRWCSASWSNCSCVEMATDAISAALAAMGASVVRWRRPEDYEYTPHDPLAPSVLIGDANGLCAVWQRDRPLPIGTTAWAEMAALPAWAMEAPPFSEGCPYREPCRELVNCSHKVDGVECPHAANADRVQKVVDAARKTPPVAPAQSPEASAVAPPIEMHLDMASLPDDMRHAALEDESHGHTLQAHYLRLGAIVIERLEARVTALEQGPRWTKEKDYALNMVLCLMRNATVREKQQTDADWIEHLRAAAFPVREP